MAKSFMRASIIGSRNTRYSNTTGDLDLQVDLSDSSGNGNLVEAVAFSEDASGSLNNASADAATEANVGILFSSPGTTSPSPVIRSSRGGRVGVFGRTDVFALAAGSETELATGFADASANFNGPTGGIINDTSGSNFINSDGVNGTPNPDIKIAGAGQIGVEMINVANATAAGEEGATAQADMGDGFFGIKDTGIQINGGAANTTPGDLPESEIVSAIGAGIFSDAYSTTGDASANSGSLVDTTEVVGIYNGLVTDISGATQANGIDFASSGLVAADAGLEIGSTAESTSGDASANTLLSLAAGIYNADNGTFDSSNNPLTQATDLLIEIDGPLSIVEGDATVLADATATSATGAALANIGSSLIGGIVDERTLNDSSGGSLISFGDSGTVRANAFADNLAYAQSSGVGGDASDAIATINNDEVVGLAMDVVADGSLSIEASATSIQNATASGDNFDGGSDPFARVADNDDVNAVENSDLITYGNLQDTSVSATLVGDATAVSDQGTGGTTATAGGNADIRGIVNSRLTALGGLEDDGGNPSNLNINVSTDLSATASSRTDNVGAFAGDTDWNAGDEAEVRGLEDVNIQILGGGSNQGSINILAEGSADAIATSESGNAEAAPALRVWGIEDSSIFLRGDNGDPSDGIVVTANLSGSGIVEGSTAVVESDFRARGIDLNNSSSIEIDRNGSVFASATMDAPTTSATATGGGTADVESDPDVTGILLSGVDSSITLGDNGSITGYGTLTDVMATATATDSGLALTDNEFDVFGIDANNSTVTAGRISGDVDGQAYATGTVTANSFNGLADASNNALTVGVDNLNITAGLVTGGNEVVGISDSSMLTTAEATGTGSAQARSDMIGFGFRGSNNSLRLNGNITAQGTLSNSAVADAALGSALAESISEAVGVEDYSVSTIGSSTINVRAGGSFSATSFGGSGLV